MPADTLKPSYERGIYLVFLERLTKEKGPEAAIRIARATGLDLRMAAKVPWAQTRYNKDRLQPLVEESKSSCRLAQRQRERRSAQGRFSAALPNNRLAGAVWASHDQAMACGTPVIAYRRGSVPEVVDDVSPTPLTTRRKPSRPSRGWASWTDELSAHSSSCALPSEGQWEAENITSTWAKPR
jgi:glycosyltransferase involved in cell wall biosynthesis